MFHQLPDERHKVSIKLLNESRTKLDQSVDILFREETVDQDGLTKILGQCVYELV